MKLRVDYHFHPNLPKSETKAVEKCKRWWKKFSEEKINCIIVTEHSYKDPERAYSLINKTKPKGMHCIPGVEYCTREGIDIIIFSKREKIYDIKELETFKLNFEETLRLIEKRKDLFATVTHPYTLGLTSVLDKLGWKVYQDAVNRLGSVEISNGSFDILEKVLPCFLFRSKLAKIQKHKELPKNEYPKKVRFLTAGSDAHQISEVGNCVELETTKPVFSAITNNKGFKLIRKERRVSMLELLRGLYIAVKEYKMKKRLKRCLH